MGRTQIYLGSDELELLDRVARATGASRSELVRRAVRSTFGQPTKADKLQASALTRRGLKLRLVAADTSAMTAATDLARMGEDTSASEPAWTAEAFEQLSEEAVVGLLLRRMRKLLARGYEPTESLIAASRADLPIP